MTPAPDRCGCGAAGPGEPLFEIASEASGARTLLLRCPSCGSLYPERLPDEPEAARLYDLLPRTRSAWRRRVRRLADLTRRDYLDRALPPGARRVLDYGCGAGDYARRIAAPGRDVFGADLLPPADTSGGWRAIGLDDLEALAPYDWITLGHVIEHLEDPLATIERLVALLAPGGGLWIATPNADSFLIRAAGPAARDIDYPRHRRIFSRRALEAGLAARGLAVTWRRPPLVNAFLNAATTARALHPLNAARLWLALLRHLFSGAQAPELVAVCRRELPHSATQ